MNAESTPSNRQIRVELLLFCTAIAAYLLTRCIGLKNFPIFFFCDEAYIGVHARYLLENNFHDPLGRFLPLFYEKAPGRWVPQIVLYLSMIGSYFWPTSIVALRAVSVVLGVLAAVVTSLTLRTVMPENRWWWLAAFFLAVSPVVYIHSALAMESGQALSLYSIFLGSYLLYRHERTGFIWLAVASALVMLYSHLSGSTVIALTAVAFALIDLRYHLSKLPLVLKATAVAVAGCLPFLLWFYTMPDAPGRQLEVLNSGWSSPGGLRQALYDGLSRWAAALDPSYWYSEGPQDQIRHIWKGRTLLPLWSAPLLLAGILASLLQIKRAGAPIVLAALIIGTAPVIWVESHIQRVFYLIAPIAYLVSIGAHAIHRLLLRPTLSVAPVALLVGAALSLQSFQMHRESRQAASSWYTDYGLYGIQWGSSQLFEEVIPRYLKSHPHVTVVPSSSWANGAEIFPDFFLTPAQRSRVASLGFNLFSPERPEALTDRYVFVLSPADRAAIAQSNLFEVTTHETVLYPNGQPGFTLASLRYVDNVKEIIARHKAWETATVTTLERINNQDVHVEHSRLDLGSIAELFDTRLNTVARGMAANPMVLRFTFTTPVMISKLSGEFWPMNTEWRVTATTIGGERISKTIRRDITNQEDTSLELGLAGSPQPITQLDMEVYDHRQRAGYAHVHIKELHWE